MISIQSYSVCSTNVKSTVTFGVGYCFWPSNNIIIPSKSSSPKITETENWENSGRNTKDK